MARSSSLLLVCAMAAVATASIRSLAFSFAGASATPRAPQRAPAVEMGYGNAGSFWEKWENKNSGGYYLPNPAEGDEAGIRYVPYSGSQKSTVTFTPSFGGTSTSTFSFEPITYLVVMNILFFASLLANL